MKLKGRDTVGRDLHSVAMATMEEYDREGLVVPPRNTMVLRFSHLPFKSHMKQ